MLVGYRPFAKGSGVGAGQSVAVLTLTVRTEPQVLWDLTTAAEAARASATVDLIVKKR